MRTLRSSLVGMVIVALLGGLGGVATCPAVLRTTLRWPATVNSQAARSSRSLPAWAPGSSSLSTSAGASASEGTIADAIAGEIPFEITYDPADILASNTYTLSARIEDEEGYLLFINDTSIPAVTGGAPVTDIEVVVIDVRPPAEPRVIELEADAAIRFLDANGQQVREIPVTPGETVVFRIRNTAGFDHSFWIGTDEELSVVGKKTDIGVGPWSKGVREVVWTVPEDISGLMFTCTVPGHCYTMQGSFTVVE